MKSSAIVALDGSGDFKTVQEAINAAPSGTTKYFVIHIKPGTYKQKLTVSKEKGQLCYAARMPPPPFSPSTNTLRHLMRKEKKSALRAAPVS